MLRIVVLVLVLANAAFYGWSQGLLDGVVGLRAQGDREPERMNRQVRADSVRVLPPSAAASQTEAVQCLEAGPYTPEQVGLATASLQTTLPADSWRSIRTEAAGVWLVYMGKYPNRESLQKKIDELKRLKVTYEEVHAGPEFDGGLSLGRFDSQAAAEHALAEFTQRGVRTARVVMLSAATATHTLRIEQADASLQAKLAGLSAAGLLGKAFTACR